MNPSSVGNVSEGMVLSALIKSGRSVLLPFGGSLRYDMAVDEGEIRRIQVKTARVDRGAIRFPGSSVNRDSKRRSHYRGQADYFGVYCPENDRVYLVPVDEVPSREVSLRLVPCLNNQTARIRWAKDYEI